MRECVRVSGMIFVADRVSSGTGKNKSSNLKKKEEKKRCQTIEVKRLFLDFFFSAGSFKSAQPAHLEIMYFLLWEYKATGPSPFI